jgi:Ca-activated chloride channel family protein
MRFAYSDLWWLFSIPILALLLMGFASWKRKQTRLLLGDPELISTLTSSLSVEKRLIKSILIMLALIAVCLGSLRPQFGRRSEVQQQSGIDIAVAFDISKSMLARDVQPSRLEAARSQLSMLIQQLSGDRVALVPFAGIAFTQSPLTADKSAFRLYLKSLSPKQMPVGGTNLAMAIREAMKRLSSSQDRGDRASRSQVILLMTDGEDLSKSTGDDVKQAAQEAKEAGILIYAVAVGTRSGEPIPILNEDGSHAGYQRDRQNKPIYSKLNMTLLQEIARITDPEHPDEAKVFNLDSNQSVVLQLTQALNRLQKSKLESTVRHRYGEKYFYAVIPALFFLLLELLITDRKKRGGV